MVGILKSCVLKYHLIIPLAIDIQYREEINMLTHKFYKGLQDCIQSYISYTLVAEETCSC